MQKDFPETLYVKINRTARFHRGKKLVYVRETIALNGRHSIDILVSTPGWLPHIKKFELYEVEFLFPEDNRKINDLRDLRDKEKLTAAEAIEAWTKCVVEKKRMQKMNLFKKPNGSSANLLPEKKTGTKAKR